MSKCKSKQVFIILLLLIFVANTFLLFSCTEDNPQADLDKLDADQNNQDPKPEDNVNLNNNDEDDDHRTGPYYPYVVSFESNSDFVEFYAEFKKQNSYQAFSFDLDDNILFSNKKYKFTCVPFNHSLLTLDNLYNYKYDDFYFDYNFSYKTESEIEYLYPTRMETEYVEIECYTLGWSNEYVVSLKNLTYTLKEITNSTRFSGIYNYSVCCGDEELLTIKIEFVNKSQNNNEEYANKILEELKKSLNILK